MKQLLDAFHFRGFNASPASAAALMRPFANAASPSMNALLRLTGPFKPARDAWQFPNAGASLTLEDAAVLRGIYQGFVDDVALIGVDTLRTTLAALSFTVPGAGATGLPAAAIDLVVNQVTGDIHNQLADAIIASIPGTYGRCGGFAFSALDFFLAGWPIDPSITSYPSTGPVRDYIWARLVNSIQANGAAFLEYFMILKILPVISTTASAALGAIAGAVIGGPLGAAIGGVIAGKDDILGLGGADKLLGKTKDALASLAGFLATRPAWPIGFVYGSKGTITDEHQVLAIGYQDNGNGAGILNIWDNAWTGDVRPSCQSIYLYLTGSEVMAASAQGPDYNDIKGIICEQYAPVIPTASLQIPWPATTTPPWKSTDCAPV